VYITKSRVMKFHKIVNGCQARLVATMDTHFILPLICISFKIESIKNNINALLIFEIGKSYRFLPITNIKYITIAYVVADLKGP